MLFGVDMKIVGDDGGDLPWDGTSFGDLLVRGPWILREYFKGEGGNPLKTDDDGARLVPDRRCRDHRCRTATCTSPIAART